MLNVQNKWCLITGASRGIGKLIALQMAKYGANLILHSRNLNHTAELENEIKAFGVDCFSVECDLNDLDSVAKMLETIDESGKQVDIVFNDAGLQIAYRTDYYSTPASDYLVSFNVNTISPMMICYHFLPKMIERGFGRVINTTSGIDGEPEQAGYSAAKAALKELIALTDDANSYEEGCKRAWYFREKVVPVMDALRAPVDELEMLVAKDMWPMPSYEDLLFEV